MNNRAVDVRHSLRTLILMLVIAAGATVPAVAQSHEPDPDAMKAWTEFVEAFRERDGLGVQTEVLVELQEGDIVSTGDTITAEFVFGPDRHGLVKLNGFTCALGDGEFVAVHDGTDDAYYMTPDDDAPYYVLLHAFIDIPYPHLALAFGADDVRELCMQFHPKAAWVVPTSVDDREIDGVAKRIITLTSDQERVEVTIDVDTKLIDTVKAEIFGGYLVQPGTSLHYTHTYTYDVQDDAMPRSAYTLDVSTRQRVDHMASLIPRPAVPDVGDAPQIAEADLVGQPAPDVILTTMNGGVVDLEELQGQVVVLDFWATWCGPCRAALPALHDIATWADDESLPVKVLTVNVWEREEQPDARLDVAKAFWAEQKFTLPVLMDYSNETANAFKVTGIPTTVVIRSDGTIHTKHTGFNAAQLKQDITGALEALEATP